VTALDVVLPKAISKTTEQPRNTAMKPVVLQFVGFAIVLAVLTIHYSLPLWPGIAVAAAVWVALFVKWLLFTRLMVPMLGWDELFGARSARTKRHEVDDFD
jgi:hypothetical protein